MSFWDIISIRCFLTLSFLISIILKPCILLLALYVVLWLCFSYMPSAKSWVEWTYGIFYRKNTQTTCLHVVIASGSPHVQILKIRCETVTVRTATGLNSSARFAYKRCEGNCPQYKSVSHSTCDIMLKLMSSPKLSLWAVGTRSLRHVYKCKLLVDRTII